jgi:hypothetical protein
MSMTAPAGRRPLPPATRPARRPCAALALPAAAIAAVTFAAAQNAYAGLFGTGLSFASEPVPLAQADIHESLDQELLLLSEARARVFLSLRRMPRHLPALERALRERNVPDDFKFLPLAVTNLDPLFRSGQRRGIWRMTEDEARNAGLAVTSSVDQRLDPVASSEGAAARIAGLHSAWGSWTSALAAFLDEPAFAQASNDAGGERDYYRLYVPDTLERAVSQVLAGKLIYSDPAAYGYRPSRAWPALAASRAVMAEGGSLRELARRYGTDYKTFRDMNPHVLQDSVPPGTALNVP